MCMAHEIRCRCGSRTASFHFRDNIMSGQAIRDLYCPECSSTIRLNPGTMVVDNGWVIEYDMDRAKLMVQKIGRGEISPDSIFDEGYCSWNGIYPGDHLERVRERERITVLAKTDPLLYLREMRSWAAERTKRLQKEGWRKAHEGESSET